MDNHSQLTKAEGDFLKRAASEGGKADVEYLKNALQENLVGIKRIAGGLIRHGLVEPGQEIAKLTNEGFKVAQHGLPERNVADLLFERGGRILLADLSFKSPISKQDVSVATGWLRKKQWASIVKGAQGPEIMLPGESPPLGFDERTLQHLLKVHELPAASIDENVLAQLLERKLVVVDGESPTQYVLTAMGLAKGNELLNIQVDGHEALGQITPEILANWKFRPDNLKKIRPFDFAVPVAVPSPGKPHPLTHIITEIRQIFWGMGFTEIAGDYVESAHWNMDALFIPQDHPARDMQDTFYLAEPASIPVPKADLERVAAVHQTGGTTGSTGWGGRFDDAVSQKALLRTHTTNTTIRHLAAHPKEPLKAFGLGRVFRKETMDATHLPEFTQIEGIVTEPGATFDTLVGLCRHFFARMGFPEVRFRPAYFPYTEPSMEIDVFYNGRWMELGGCGIFRPEVTKPLGVRDNVVAWGFGLERLAMMRLGLKDIRDLYVSDIDWLRTAPLR